MLEQWSKWEPVKDIPQKMYMESLLDNKNGILIILKSADGKYKVQILFENSILSYRNTDEGHRLKTINFLDEIYGKDFYSKWTLFKITNSTYIDWFKEETYGIYDDYNIEHYIFLTSDDVVEVLSTYEPEVTII